MITGEFTNIPVKTESTFFDIFYEENFSSSPSSDTINFSS